jgi:hypothetical protein
MNLTASTTMALGLLVVAAMLATPAHATLGEKATSIAKDRKALSAVKRGTTAFEKYSVQEMASDASTVREYVNADGMVFAVAWNGMTHPNLTSLLGSYADDYGTAKRQQPRRHGQKRSKVQGEQVVVETWGHMRDLRGRAYLPSLLPEGVAVNEIK